jgi:glutaredoxin
MEAKKLIALLAFVALVLGGVVVYTQFGGQLKFGGSNLAKAEKTAYDFIDQQMLNGQVDFEIKEFKEEKGLYKMLVNVNGQEIESYMTKDLKTFFPSPVDMEKVAGAKEEQQQQQQANIPAQDEVDVKLFTQSFCPYGNQAEDLMKPVAELLGDQVDIEPHYVLYENYRDGSADYCIDEAGTYCSMHGVDELKQDLRELCVYNNQPDKYWEFVSKVNQDCTADDVESCWTGAAETVGVNTAQVESCYADNYLAYAEEENALNKELDVSASPTLLINGVKYQGSRTSEAYKDAICSGFKEQPQECETELSSDANAASGSCN